MKIGLVRHFKVNHKFPSKFLVSAEEVVQWFDEYEFAEIEHAHVDFDGVDYKICYTSPLGRANKTAVAIFNGEIRKSDALRELEALPWLNQKLRLPFLVWAILVRYKSRKNNKITEEFKSRLQAFVDDLLANHQEDVLIVSHVFVMMFLQKELIHRGFMGDDPFKTPEHNKVYLFERRNL